MSIGYNVRQRTGGYCFCAPLDIAVTGYISYSANILAAAKCVCKVYICGRRVFYARLVDTDDIVVLYFHAAWRCVCGKRRMGGIGR